MARSYSKWHEYKVRSGFNKESKQQRDSCVMSVYKYLLDNAMISHDGPAAKRYNELIYRKGQ